MATLTSSFPRILAKALLASCGMFFLLGGCVPDKDQADSGKPDAAPELEHCTHKVSACRNDCYKSGAGSKCTDCCRQNGLSCDQGGSYSFYSCPNEE
jgi:hypothetical protein